MNFKKITQFFFLGLLLLAAGGYAQNKKPNIILVYADDISARELPIYNSTVWNNRNGKGESSDIKLRAKTPVLDRLATEGCYVKTAWAATICSPSRAMMMTGRYAYQTKWWHNGDLGKYTTPNGKRTVYPLYKSSPNTIGHVAKKGGYATYWAGKTQMKTQNIRLFGFDEGLFTPGEQAAEENPYTDFQVVTKRIDGKKVSINLDTDEPANTYNQLSWYWYPSIRLYNHPSAKKDLEYWPNTKKSKKEFGLSTYGPDVELDFILNFMERKHKEDKPFFIYHTTHLGHGAKDFLNVSPKSSWIGTPKIKWTGNGYVRTEPKITGDRGKYDTHNSITKPGIHNHVNYLDYQMWQYLNKLKELGIEKNTIVIFCADNGTWGYGKGNPNSQKGTHVPFIVYAPGMNLTKKGQQDILVNISDILPTVADIAGVELPKKYKLDGESLIPYLTTEKTTHRDWIYSYKGASQLIRGHKVLKDGKGTWWDVSKTPADLISFPKITDWNTVSKEHTKERKSLKKILPRFDLHAKAHDAPE